MTNRTIHGRLYAAHVNAAARETGLPPVLFSWKSPAPSGGSAWVRIRAPKGAMEERAQWAVVTGACCRAMGAYCVRFKPATSPGAASLYVNHPDAHARRIIRAAFCR